MFAISSSEVMICSTFSNVNKKKQFSFVFLSIHSCMEPMMSYTYLALVLPSTYLREYRVAF